MEHYLPALCVCVWVLGIPTPTAAETDLYRFPTQVFEVALDPDSQILYVGGVNTVHQLTTNLTLLRNTTLSPCGQGVGCDSRVRVLEVDSVLQRLLACGTNGQCWLLGLDDLSKQPLPDGFVPQDVQNPHLTQVDHQSSGSLGTSQWMVASPNHVQNLPILSIKEIGKTKTDEFTWRYSSYKQTESAIRKSSGTFVYDVVDGFCFEKECFYLTLQQVNRTNHTLINRLANTCATSLFPYVEKGLDFVIVSSVYTQYSRTVGFTLGRIRDSKNNVFVIFVFMKPESPLDDRVDGSKGFVLGSVRLSEVQKSLGITRLLCTRDDVGNKVQVPDWYAGHFGSCCTNQSQEERCPSGPIDVPVIQDRTEVIRIRYAANVTSADDDIGQVTSVFTHTESLRNETTGKLTGLDSRMTIYVLTSTGRIFKFHARIGAQMDGLDLDRLDPGLSGEGDRLHLPLPGAPTPTPYPVLSARHFYLLAGNTMAPESGPVTGNTTLTLHVLGMVEQNFVVTVCHRPCPVMVGSPSNPLGTIKCRVPESVNQTERRCAVAIQFPDGLGLDATATQSFFYTVPELYDFTPTRMLGAEPGTLIFKGKHLDSGSDVTVLGNGTILCRVASRNSSQIWCQLQSPISSLSSQRCYNLTLTIDGLDLTWTKSRSPSDPTLTPLSRRDLPGAVARRLVHPPGLFCRLPNPVVSAVHSNWTFRGGNVTMRVNGHHLDVAFVTVLLTVSGQQQSDNRACAVCPDVTDGTCLLCRTPDVRRLTSQGSAASASAEVSFEMKGRQSLQSVRHSNTTGPISIAVLSDPRFHLVKPGNSCLAVQESDKLSIQGSFLPPGVPYTLTVGGCQCEPTPRLFPLSPSSSSSSVLSCRLQSVWACLPASTTTTPTTKTSQVGKCDLNRDSSSSHGSGRSCTWNVEIHIEGRRFLAGCVSSVPEAPLHKIGVGVIVGAAVGGFLFLLLVCFCSCRYVRYRKRKFYRKRYINRHSGVSDGTLLSSEYGGSAEGRYISLDRLLNPEGDPEKQCEIEASGIIIRRRFLDLGNVVGHGNFGCVFEGRYQTEEGNDDSWQKVAVKTLISPAIHAIDLKTFIDEAMLMKNFDHRHVLGLLGLSEGDHGPLVVLPFMERGDILAYVKNEETELNLGDVLQFSVDIASGMGYLASSKFVHRDLAARNCMLDDDLRVKVADFGLCRDVYEKGYYHSDNRKKLPIRWMPPESIEKGTYTSKSDVWSMGVVMWEMLTRGITPYPGVEGWDILRYLVAGRRLDQPALCPDSVYALVERCWRLEPWERPTFRDIERDLRSLTSSLQDPHAPYTPTHLLTPITVPACHGFKDDAAIVAKVKEAMNRRAYSPEPSSSPPASASSPPASASFLAGSGEGEAAEGMEVGSRSAPVSDQGPASSRSERSSRVPEVSDLSVQQPEGGGVSTVAVPATDDHETLDHLSVESGPVLTYPRLPEVKDDGYFLLEQEAVLPPSTQPLRHSQGDSIATPGGVEAAVFVSPSSAHGEGLLAGSSDSLVTWRRVTELRTMAGMDDGYFQLEREESTQV